MSELLETFQNPTTRHAALIHFPIALALLALPLAFISALLKGDKPWWRGAVVIIFLLFTGSAYLALNSGEAAEGNLGEVAGAIHDLAHEHEETAENLGIFGIIGCALALLVWLPKKPVRLGASWLVVALSLVIIWRIGTAAHLGGQLVYDYGAGTPNPLTEAQIAARSGVAESDETGDPRAEKNDPAALADPRIVHFRENVRPILAENCFGCHNEKSKQPLNLTTFHAMQTTGKNSPIIVPGDPEASFLMRVIEHVGEIKMPKGDDQLPPERIDDIRQWIKEGAVWLEAPADEPDDSDSDADSDEG